MYQKRSIVLQNLILVTGENWCGNFFVITSCDDDPRVQKEDIGYVMRLNGMLVMTSDLGLDIAACVPAKNHPSTRNGTGNPVSWVW